MKLELIEPLKLLFKDEVRLLGEEIGLPDELVWRQPFPGPGLAIRIIGAVTKKRLAILREADDVLLEEIKKNGYYRGKILFRNLSMGIPAKNREALIFKIRMLFGVNARAEIINYLMLMNDSHPTELSRNIYFYQKTVQDVLVDMHYSGLILMNKKGREKKYYIDKQHWYDFFNYNNQQEYWINWVKIYKAFEILVTFLYDYEIKQSNEVSQEFEIRRTMKKFNGYIGISDLKVSLLDYNKTNCNPIDYLIKQSNKVYLELINS